MASTSFYVPGSLSGSYVASKRTSEGSLAYPAAETEIGIQKQAALQNLGKQYETTIENAYSSYLASQRGILESAMGQGYKEQYLQMQDQALAQNLAQANTNLASARAELETQESEAKTIVEKQYQQEVANLDRVASSFQNYLDYAKKLSTIDEKTKEEKFALNPEYAELGIDYLYETLYGLQPRETGIDGMSYSEWLQANLGTSNEDAAWYQWMQSGGLQDFLSSVRARPDYQTAEQRLTSNKESERVAKLAEAKSQTTDSTAVVDYTLNPQVKSNTITYTNTNGQENTYNIVKAYNTAYDDYEIYQLLKKIGATNVQSGTIFNIEGKRYIAIKESKTATGSRLSLYEIE